ncbi:MAG: hypothetical protein HOE90_07040 [Bacteriovoracaceae bacterium]|jgi:hypothetical protein|nr:hypothetical protein [Bacteriovoracaceae bacterium]
MANSPSDHQKEMILLKKKFLMLTKKQKKAMDDLKRKFAVTLKKERINNIKMKKENEELKRQLEFERNQRANAPQVDSSKIQKPNIDFDVLKSGNLSAEQMAKFRETLENQMSKSSEMLASAESRIAKLELQVSKKEKHVHKLNHAAKKQDEKIKDVVLENEKKDKKINLMEDDFAEIKDIARKKELEFDDSLNVKEDQIHGLRKDIRTREEKIDDLEAICEAFDIIRIREEVIDLKVKALETVERVNQDEMQELLEDVSRMKMNLRDYDKTLGEKFINMYLDIESSESNLKEKIFEKVS